MRTFIGTSPKIEGDFVFRYNANGYLIGTEIPDTIPLDPHLWLLDNLPITQEELPRFSKRSGLAVTEELTEITFDVFYSRYAVKEARKKAENAWNSLSKAEQRRAFRYIDNFKRKLSSKGTALPYPALYLNQKRWND